MNVAMALLLAWGSSAQPPLDWAAAEKAIVRLPPSAFPQLPVRVSADLRRRGCTIPQAWSEPTPNNVIRGEFFRRGVKDWAVLCSRRGRSNILVFRSGQAKPAAELAAGNDVNWLQTVAGDGRIGYSRILSAAGRREILEYRKAFGGPLPNRLDHQGIEDYFEGKASIIRYFSSGRWVELTGMD